MKITLKRVNLFHDDIKNIGKLYKAAFPFEERAPFALMAAKTLKRGVDCWSVYADRKWVGFAYVVNNSDLSYLFYFAFSENERGKGYGTKVLSALREMYIGRRLFIALEQLDSSAANYNERVKRRQFYLKNGMIPLRSTIREGKVIFDVMGIGGEILPYEYVRLMRDFFGFPTGDLFAMDSK